jgi:hypothetical protein
MSDFQPKRLFLNSDDRTSGTHSNFTIELPSGVVNCKKMTVSLVTIPALWYPFAPYQSHIYWQINKSVTSIGGFSFGAGTVLITNVALEGRYWTSGTDVVNQVNSDIINETYIYTPSLGDNSANIPNNRIANISATDLVFTSNDTTTKKMAFTSAPGIKFMGYQDVINGQKLYYNNLTYWLSHVLTNSNESSPFQNNTNQFIVGGGVNVFYSLNRTGNVYIASDLSTGDNVCTNGRRDILAKIPVQSNTAYGDVVVFQSTLEDDISQLSRTIKNIRFTLLDDDFFELTDMASDGPGNIHLSLSLSY